jgi:putative transposase
MITKRPRRLEGVSYVGFQRYSLTICTAFRGRILVSSPIVDPILSQLRQCASSFEFAIVAYCFMPDLVHLLVIAQSQQTDFVEFARRFKQITAFHYKRTHKTALWQPGYHERILRDDEATEVVVRYILENPIRAGLAKRLGEYPFAGSDVYDLSALLTAWDHVET